MTLSASAVAVGPNIAWEENFDSADALAAARVFYSDSTSDSKSSLVGEELVIKEVADGVLRLGVRYVAKQRNAGVNMLFGDPIWWEPGPTPWGPFETKKHPLVEIKWRSNGEGFMFNYAVEKGDSAKQAGYTWARVHAKETDSAGREWNISRMRLAPDSSVPSKATAVKLLGINITIRSFQSQGRPAQREDAYTEIDYIRVRGLTEEEAQREANVVATLSDFPEGVWSGLDSFFPWGVYGTGFLRGDFEWWAGDYEGAYGIYSRNHINFIATNYEIELSRVGGRALSTDDWSSAVDSYAAAVAPLIESARATGLKRAGDVRYLHTGRDPNDGYKQLLPIAKRITQEVHPDDDIIVAWTLADEPGIESLLKMAGCIRALRETDPHKRPGLIAFNSTFKMAPYAPYLGVNYWGNYPVLGGSRDPWNIRVLARQYRKLLPDVPMWPVLQAFETRPPTPDSSYTRPSDAEIRLMAYLAIAEGAKGIVWFHGYGSGRDEHLLERTGHARGGMLATLSGLGRRLIPIGQILLQTDPLDDPRIAVAQLTNGDAERFVTVSALKHRTAPVRFLVVINEDINNTRAAKAKILDSNILADGQGVYDLYSLDGKNLVTEKDAFPIKSLAGGDARIYACCSLAEFENLRTRILSASALENLRSLSPELAIARRWRLDMTDVDGAIADCKAAAELNDPKQALESARFARSRLFADIENNSELASVRNALRDIGTELTEVLRVTEYYSINPRWWTGRDHPMCIPNPTLLDLSKRYFEVGRSYRDCYSQYIKGDTEGLWTKLNTTRIDCLQMREGVLAFLREKLKPAQEPPVDL
jgi:hypothetical protein